MKDLLTGKGGRPFLLLLLVVFFVGISGRLMLSTEARETVPITLTVRSYPEDALLLSHLPLKAGNAKLDDVPVTVTALSVSPAMRVRVLPEGGVISYPSVLTAELSATLVLEGEIREGHFYSSGIYLPVGKEAVLSTEGFTLSVRIFHAEKG